MERARPWARDVDLADHGRNMNGTQQQDDLNGAGWTYSQRRRRSKDGSEPYFTYTPSIAWAWRAMSGDSIVQERGHEDLGTGHLGDEIIIGVGMDDVAQGFVKVKIDEILTCLRLCPL